MLESSHIQPLHKWVLAYRLMNSSKKGFSAHQLHRTIKVTYKTAWFMSHRIRESMRPCRAHGPELRSTPIRLKVFLFNLQARMKGIYQHCSEKHLHRYLAEFDFRYSNRIALGVDDTERTDRAIKGGHGKRLTYNRLVQRNRHAQASLAPPPSCPLGAVLGPICFPLEGTRFLPDKFTLWLVRGGQRAA